MAKDIQYKENEDKFFTKEFWAVMLMVFSLMCFLPLVCGKVIFYNVGLYIQHFILGVLGYVAYPLFPTLFIIGYKVLLDKKFYKGFKRTCIFACWIVALLVFSLITTIQYPSTNLELSEYLSTIFISGKLGPSGVICSGAILGIPVYYLCDILTVFGSIAAQVVVVAIIILVITMKYIKMPKDKIVPEKEVEEELSQPINKQIEIPVRHEEEKPLESKKSFNGYDMEKFGFKTATHDPFINQPSDNQSYYTPSEANDILFNTKNVGPLDVEPDNSYNNSSDDSYSNPNVYHNIVENVDDVPLHENVVKSSGIFNENIKVEDAINDPTIPDFNTYRVEEKLTSPKKTSEESIKKTEMPKEEIVIDESFNKENGPKFDEFVPKDEVVNIASISDENIYENMPIGFKYNAPPVTLLDEHEDSINEIQYNTYRSGVEKAILTVLSMHKINTRVVKVYRGPAVSRFVIEVPMDVDLAKVTVLEKDINLRVQAFSHIRMIAPIPGTQYVGIEVENPARENVYLRNIFNECEQFVNPAPKEIRFLFGKNMVGEPISFDIREMPHCLISGITGSGKSVCINTMICSLMMKYSPEELRFIIIDPKYVDFISYENIPHMMFNHIVNNDMALINSTLQWICDEMDRRCIFMSGERVKKLADYNEKARLSGKKLIPSLVVIIDEFADIMMQDKQGISEKIIRIASKARSSDIHLVLAAQRPSADIVNGPIKSNLPTRFVFKAQSNTDSIVSLGEVGAQYLMGKGDCLVKSLTSPNVERVMGAFMSDEEVDRVVDYAINNNESYFDTNGWNTILSRVSTNHAPDTMTLHDDLPKINPTSVAFNNDDNLLADALLLGFKNNGNISISNIQRSLSVGFNRAGKILNILVDKNYVSSNKIGNQNKLQITKEQFKEFFGRDVDEELGRNGN